MTHITPEQTPPSDAALVAMEEGTSTEGESENRGEKGKEKEGEPLDNKGKVSEGHWYHVLPLPRLGPDWNRAELEKARSARGKIQTGIATILTVGVGGLTIGTTGWALRTADDKDDPATTDMMNVANILLTTAASAAAGVVYGSIRSIYEGAHSWMTVCEDHHERIMSLAPDTRLAYLENLRKTSQISLDELDELNKLIELLAPEREPK